VATSITADDMLAALRKWGITPKFYRDNWRTWNRNAQQGWGPLRGVVIHNYGSSGSDTNQLAYLYRGDGPTSSKPGPLSQFAVTDDGTLWVIGWGTATHSGPGDPKADAKARANSLPLTSEHAPTTIGTDSGTVRINPHYLGVEQCHGPEGPTPAQRATTVRWAAAMLDMMGGPADGYGAGSVLMHRELTKNRSDPQDIPKDGVLRREIAAVLKSPPTLQEEDDMFTDADRALLKAVRAALPAANALTRNAGDGTAPRVLDSGDGYVLAEIARGTRADVGALRAVVAELAKGQPLTTEQITEAAKVGAAAALDEKIAGADVTLEVTPPA
jgi:hypothetical protein